MKLLFAGASVAVFLIAVYLLIAELRGLYASSRNPA